MGERNLVMGNTIFGWSANTFDEQNFLSNKISDEALLASSAPAPASDAADKSAEPDRANMNPTVPPSHNSAPPAFATPLTKPP